MGSVETIEGLRWDGKLLAHHDLRMAGKQLPLTRSRSETGCDPPVQDDRLFTIQHCCLEEQLAV